MEIIRIPRILRDTSKEHILHGRKIGLIPTMGALHEGHLSLVRRARQENDITVVSIFVNPTQFGPSEDFQAYPRDIEGDTEKLLNAEVDILFMPDLSLVYPSGFLTYVEVCDISAKLCGAARPGHFRGVATIVTKLFHIISPTRAYFGQKDFQQTVVIRHMVRDLDLDVDIVVCPTVRERNGLAMSSRNSYLDPAQREAASIIYQSLTAASEAVQSGIIDVNRLKEVMREKILSEPAVSRIDYAGVYDPETLDESAVIKGDVVFAVAVRIGEARLIDNILLNFRKER